MKKQVKMKKQINIWPVLLVVGVVATAIVFGVKYNDSYVKGIKDADTTKTDSVTVSTATESTGVNDSIPKTEQSVSAKSDTKTTVKNDSTKSKTATPGTTVINAPEQRRSSGTQNNDFNTRDIPEGVDKVINQPIQVESNGTQNNTF